MINTRVLPTKEDINFFKDNEYWVALKIINDDCLELLPESMKSIYEEI